MCAPTPGWASSRTARRSRPGWRGSPPTRHSAACAPPPASSRSRISARGRRDEGEGELADDRAFDQPDPERLAASGELRRLLEAAVDALPEEFRAVFVLREVEGLSTAEAAACLALRPETVKTRLHRARRLLQEALGGRLLALSPSLFGFGGGRCDRVVARVFRRLGRGEGPREAAFPAVPLPAEPPAPTASGRR